MKTIFRYTKAGLLAAAILTVGAVTGFAQNPCEDADGMTKMGDQVRAEYEGRSTVEGLRKFANTGKTFLEKYGACEPAKELADWLKGRLPWADQKIKDMVAAKEKEDRINRFNTALNAKNWDTVYSAGKEILTHYEDEFRVVELVLGSIGYDELFKGNPKYNAETLRFAKQSLANLEAGKEYKPLGIAPFTFKNREDAIAWMNLTIGYITQVGEKNKTAAAPYLFKATQATVSDTSKNPIPYELIGFYYFDELNKLVDQIKAKEADQKDTDTEEVAVQKVEELKKLVALSNGTAERAMDAFSRAFTLGKDAAYKKKMKENVQQAYKLRFGKDEGVDAWIASAVSKPFISPLTPVQPVTDPEPVKTDAGSGAGSGNGVANAAPKKP